jgi:hypothetical protein
MLKSLALAGALAFALFSAPVVAQECTTLADAQAQVEANGFPFKKVPDEELATFLEAIAPILGGTVPEGVTAAIVAMLGETPVFGLEIGGCMTPPIAFPAGV